MATPIYLTDTTSDINPGAETELATSFARGSGVVSVACTTTSGGTSIQLLKAGTAVTWLTEPLAPVTISGTVTLNVWGMESSNSANSKLSVKVERCNAAGAVQSVIGTATMSSEIATNNNAAKTATVTPTSTDILDGERIKLTLICVNQGTMGNGYTVTAYYNGTSAGASGDTYVSFTETIGPHLDTVIKTVEGLANASIKSVLGLARASVKTVQGVA